MLWRWRLGREDGEWKRFDAKAEQEVEQAYLRRDPTVRSAFFNPHLQQHTVYDYDLNEMQQVPPPPARLTRCQAAEYTRGALVVHAVLTIVIRTSRPRASGETPCFAQKNETTGFRRWIKRELHQSINPPRPAPAPHHAHTAPAPQHHGHHGTDYGYPTTPCARLGVERQEMVHAMHHPKAPAPHPPIGQQIPDTWLRR